MLLQFVCIKRNLAPVVALTTTPFDLTKFSGVFSCRWFMLALMPPIVERSLLLLASNGRWSEPRFEEADRNLGVFILAWIKNIEIVPVRRIFTIHAPNRYCDRACTEMRTTFFTFAPSAIFDEAKANFQHPSCLGH